MKQKSDLKALQKETDRLRASMAAKEAAQERLLQDLRQQRIENEIFANVLELQEREQEMKLRPNALWNPLTGLEEKVIAYKHAQYKVEGLSTPIVIGKNNPELDDLSLQHPPIEIDEFQKGWAYLTAWNPMSQKQPHAQNKRQNQQLQQRLEHYKTFPGVGESMDMDWMEESFLVLAITLSSAKFYARTFRQQAFVYGEWGKPAQLYMRAAEGLPFHLVK